MFPLQTTAPTRSPPLVTWALIAANCAIFLFQIGLGPEELEHFLYQFALIPARYFAPLPFKDFVGDPLDYLPFVSNMFLHGGWLHLILNMWTLWLFGPAVEDRLGTVPLHRLLRLLRRLLPPTPTRPSIRFDHSGARRFGRNRRRARRSPATLSLSPVGDPGADPLPPLLLRGAGRPVYAGLWFLIAAHTGHGGDVRVVDGRRHRLVGPYRRLRRRPRPRPTADAVEAALTGPTTLTKAISASNPRDDPSQPLKEATCPSTTSSGSSSCSRRCSRSCASADERDAHPQDSASSKPSGARA